MAIAFLVLALASVNIILGHIPASVVGLGPRPNPAGSYEEALARFAAAQRAEASGVCPECRSLLLIHGRSTEQVFLLVHGTTNSPRQWETLGKVLHARGHNVLILRMPRHGRVGLHVGELAGLRAEALRDYADLAVNLAAGLGSQITAVGISGGAAVTAWMAQHRPEVRRMLALAPFFAIHGLPLFLNGLVTNLVSWAPNLNLQDPREPRRSWGYRGQSTRGFAAYLRLTANVFQAAVVAPPAAERIIFVTTAVEDTADNRRTAELASPWSGAGARVTGFEFPATADIPHNAVDPAADPQKRAIVLDKMLALLVGRASGGCAAGLSIAG